MKDFRQLKVWEKAHELTMACYQLTKRFPKDELFGLTAQIRRSAASILPISPRAVEGQATLNSTASSRCPAVPPANWNIISCLPKISAISMEMIIKQLKKSSWS